MKKGTTPLMHCWLPALMLATCLSLHDAQASGPMRVPSTGDVLRTLRAEHPRLLARTGDFEALRRRIADDDQFLIRWHQELLRKADELLDTKPPVFDLSAEREPGKLLWTSRAVYHRVATLGMAYQLTGEQRYADRVWEELEAAAGFPNWNPRHFLDTAEMTFGFALGYDWLYDAWTEPQREMLREAIVKHGLNEGLKCYRGEADYGWWRNAALNWNAVCNSGMIAGALAVADHEPEIASQIIHSALHSLPRVMSQFAPDGGSPEGPGYWSYTISYVVRAAAALESALGTDFGLSRYPGVDRTALFPVHTHGPTDLVFNFADCGGGGLRQPEMLWLAKRFDLPDAARFQQRRGRAHAFDLLWYDGHVPGPIGLPLDAYFRGVNVVTMRGSWEDPDATFVAFQAGANDVAHGHLDLGSFVIDALGERWAWDLGSDRYSLPDYFRDKRYTYYRLRAEAHNTLVINPGQGPDQDPKATGRIIKFSSTPERVMAIADLTPAYKADAHRVRRGIALLDRRNVLVQDELDLRVPGKVWWFMTTRAQVELTANDRTALLTQNNQQFAIHLIEPEAAAFQVLPAKPLPTSLNPPGQRENKNMKRLAIELAGARSERIIVWMSPVPAHQTAPDPSDAPPTTPLGQW